MRISPRHRLAGLALLPLLLIAATACQGSVSVGTPPSVSKADLVSKMVETYSAQGVTADMVSCPDDLPAKVDATVECTITEGDGTVTDFTLSVNTVDGTNVDYSITPQE